MLLNGIVLFDQENDFSAMKLKEHEFRAITQSLRYYSKCIRTVHAGHSAFDVFAPAHETSSRLTGQNPLHLQATIALQAAMASQAAIALQAMIFRIQCCVAYESLNLF